MTNAITKIIFLLLINYSIQLTYTPVQVIELWRHGARTPSRNTLNETYVEREGPGNIIGNGERMHYILGMQIRKTYPTIFPNKSDVYLRPEEYMVYSTDYQRTILSAYSHLYGLFPFDTGLKITANLTNSTNLKYVTPPFKGIPIEKQKIDKSDYTLPYGIDALPVHVLPKYKDKIFMKMEENTCPIGYNSTKKAFVESIPTKQKSIAPLVAELEKAGINASEIFKGRPNVKFDLNTTGIYADIAKCNAYYNANGQLYKGLTPQLMKKLEEVFGIFYINYRFNTIKMTKVYTTRMMQLILKEMEDRISGKGKRKYLGLSGHEANLVPFMMRYDLISESCLVTKLNGATPSGICRDPPEFAANMIWELSRQEENKAYYVRVRYNGDLVKTCSQPNSDGYCQFKDFKSFATSKLILSNQEYLQACGNEILPKREKVEEKSQKVSFIRNKLLWHITFVGCIVICLLLVFVIYSLTRKISSLSKSANEEKLHQQD